jgi:hypothetical protein
MRTVVHEEPHIEVDHLGLGVGPAEWSSGLRVRGTGLQIRRKALEQDLELEQDAEAVSLIYECEV